MYTLYIIYQQDGTQSQTPKPMQAVITPDAFYVTASGTTVRAYHYVSRKTNEPATRLVWPSGSACVVRRQQVDSLIDAGRLRANCAS